MNDVYEQLPMFGASIVTLPTGYVNEAQLQAWQLSKREREVVRLACRAMKDWEIAQTLDLTVATVKSYLKRVFLKARVTSRHELTLLATRPPGEARDHGLRLVV